MLLTFDNEVPVIFSHNEIKVMEIFPDILM